MSGPNHMKYMLLGGGALFVLLLLFGVTPQSALLIAIALACPLMMIFMMAGDHSAHGSGHARPGPRDQGLGDVGPHDADRNW